MGAYQLKITIKGSKPPIWRRVLVPEGITFGKLHQMIQTAFCWSDGYLYEFEFRSEGVRVVPNKENWSPKFQYLFSDETISRLVSSNSKFTYTYGADKNWELSIQVEDMVVDYKESCGQVVKFKGAEVPETCGSIAGYYELLESGSKGSEEYNITEVNRRLSQGGKSASEEVRMEDIYNCYDKNSILEIAKRHGMSGLSKLKKEELAERTIAHILDQKVMSRYFLCARDSEIKLFEQLAEGDFLVPSTELEEMDFLYAGGYVTAGLNNQFMVAKEVIKAYKEVNTPEFKEERERLSKIGDYFRAANSLYAVTPIQVLLETFNKYEDKKLTAEELLQAHELLQSFRPVAVYTDGKFVDGALAEQNGMEELLRMQKKVPYYIPAQQEIRFLADHGGFLMTQELGLLSTFLRDEMKVSDEKITYILRQVQAEISMGGQLPEIVDGIEAAGIIFESEEHMERFTSIITDVWNHTRMVLNRGHKPYEMVMKGLETVSVQRKNPPKIYPNDPCSCGSGKKYKKCCGKKS
ncbi:plasmid pRiA4b ORF-3 family protein [Lacrimispora saccharolytica]|uniref:Plasmid pRiA4b ORF-3 family protein n=1 Tax=Lacrimispora saccharolytica (strain ATCC 35040 / DSM 2544 / NRCC 2533 / WM1) TaxID=610130 RepID=D9R316_LACSW|nr:plasmid pRiA4b ORF-3 family protein [Lacrimispora saccharolytica]ADL03006.1 plasmid pRiA4b ORF-3 family protein [[Clostridium] saccharolyticum WM1]QRV18808.1 plasmid pRiA4b ORF-3 family protein [Lacrimispora saccharolytica]